MRNQRRMRWAAVSLVVLAGGGVGGWCGRVQAADHADFERWYTVKLLGQPVGWSVIRTTQQGDRLTSESRLHLAIRRGPMAVEVSQSAFFVETTDGKPISMTIEEKLGVPTATRREYTFTDTGITLRTASGPNVSTRQLPPIQGDWLPPEASRRYVAGQLKSGSKTFTYTTLDPSTGVDPITVEAAVDSRENITANGLPAVKLTMQVSSMPGQPFTEYLDAEARSIKSQVNMGAISFSLEQADRAAAEAQVTPPEMLQSTLIPPNKPIAKPRTLRQATYTLSVADGALPSLPTTPVQSVEVVARGKAKVTIDLTRSQPLPIVESQVAPRVESSSMIDKDDSAIIDLMRKATEGAGTDPAKRAEAMRKFVYHYITAKNMSMGLASASETARSAAGDCTEHAVLLAAMLRADGIPSRTVSGIVYADRALGESNIFGFHMWSSAWLDGRWVDLDATLDADVPFDATHIALATSTLADGQAPVDLVKLTPLLGRLKIEVE